MARRSQGSFRAYKTSKIALKCYLIIVIILRSNAVRVVEGWCVNRCPGNSLFWINVEGCYLACKDLSFSILLYLRRKKRVLISNFLFQYLDF